MPQTSLLIEYLQYFPCVAILGPRQCGKTTLARQVPNNWTHFDLENAADFEIISKDPDLFLRMNPNQLAIDEAQLLPQLFPALRVSIDANRKEAGRFIITGSSSPTLLRSISESLAGRVAIIEMNPLSYQDLCQSFSPSFFTFVKDGSHPKDFAADLKVKGDIQLTHKYWLKGGYPELWVKEQARFNKFWMDQYIRTYLDRDLKQLFPGIDDQRFRRFLQTLASLSGTVINYSEVARSIGLSQPTIRDYFEIADGTFIWRNLPAFERDSLKRVVKHPKGYYRDCGLLNHLLRINDDRSLLSHPAMGNLWEGLVIEELIRGFSSLGLSFDSYYYRTGAGAEVDLVLDGEFGLIPFEIKYGQKVSLRDLRGIRDFVKERGLDFGIVIHNDEKIRFYDERLIGIPFNML